MLHDEYGLEAYGADWIEFGGDQAAYDDVYDNDADVLPRKPVARPAQQAAREIFSALLAQTPEQRLASIDILV